MIDNVLSCLLCYIIVISRGSICSATDVLVHMLMKSAAKCNNHCELQNSVNQLVIERRSALGAFLRACLCQCLYNVVAVFIAMWGLCNRPWVCCINHCVCNALCLILAFACTVDHPGDVHKLDIKQSNLLNLSI